MISDNCHFQVSRFQLFIENLHWFAWNQWYFPSPALLIDLDRPFLYSGIDIHLTIPYCISHLLIELCNCFVTLNQQSIFAFSYYFTAFIDSRYHTMKVFPGEQIFQKKLPLYSGKWNVFNHTWFQTEKNNRTGGSRWNAVDFVCRTCCFQK